MLDTSIGYRHAGTCFKDADAHSLIHRAHSCVHRPPLSSGVLGSFANSNQQQQLEAGTWWLELECFVPE